MNINPKDVEQLFEVLSPKEFQPVDEKQEGKPQEIYSQ